MIFLVQREKWGPNRLYHSKPLKMNNKYIIMHFQTAGDWMTKDRDPERDQEDKASSCPTRSLQGLSSSSVGGGAQVKW